jgi:hypothetical protein
MTSSEVLKRCELLNSNQKRKALRLAGINQDADNSECIPGQCLLIWLVDALQVLPLKDSETRWTLLEEFSDAVKSYGELLSKSLLEKKLPECCLGIGDRRYAVISGYGSVFDLQEGTWIEGESVRPFERINYDLALLYLTRSKDVV